MAQGGGIFVKIDSRENALAVSKICGSGFLVLAGIQALLSFLFGPSLLIDSAIFAVCGFFIRQKQSRAAAVVTGILAALAVISSAANIGGGKSGEGMGLLMAGALVIGARRSIEATFKLHGGFREPGAASTSGGA